MIRSILIISIAFLCSCTSGKKGTADTGCTDPAWPGFKDCTEEYEPVCGCDGKTYPNECAAYNAKLKSWTAGPCAK